MGGRVARRWQAVRAVARLANALRTSVLFDQRCYEAQRQRHFPSRAHATLDYVLTGSRHGMAAGPLLVSPTSGVDRPPGVGAAGFWAAAQLESGFPRTGRHPLADLDWYVTLVPEAAQWPGGPLAHYTQRGRLQGARLGPLDTGEVDLVEAGAAVLQGGAPLPRQVSDAAALGTGVVGLVSADPRGEPHVTVASLLDSAVACAALVLASDASGEERLTGAAIAHSDPRVWVVADADVRTTASGADVVVVGTAHVNATPGTYQRLVDEVRVHHADVAAPVVLEVDDTVREAGRDESGTRLLAGLPWDDAIRRGDTDVSAVSGLLLALSSRTMSNFESLGSLRRSIEATAASAARAGHRVRIVSAAAAGVVSLSPEAKAPRPPMVAPRASGKVRWAIKSPHPAGPRRDTWGDWHFARGLAAALEALGHEVAVDPFHSWNRPSATYDDVTVTIRGLRRYEPAPNAVNVLWVISHPELVSDEEMSDFDVVAAASLTWAQRATTESRDVLALLQCTDPDRFRPDVAAPGTGYPLLFVGNSRSAERPLIDAAGRSRPELRIIGGGWDERMPEGVVVATHVPNSELPALYRAAGVVLNDHWATMAADGFLSNRLFDMTAAGARWVSDDVPGLREVFPTGRVARDEQELSSLLDAGDASFPTEPELLDASAAVRNQHSFLARARQLAIAVEPLLTARVTHGHVTDPSHGGPAE